MRGLTHLSSPFWQFQQGQQGEIRNSLVSSRGAVEDGEILGVAISSDRCT